jgi:hypothetical protein
MGVPGWPPQTCPRPFSNVAPRRDRCPLARRNSNLGGPIIFRVKIEGGQSHPAGGERGLGQGWVCGGQYPGGPMNLVSHKCCLTDLAFGFMPLERSDESFLSHFWVFASLRSRTGGGGSQDSAPLLGGGSLHDDDRPVVEGAGARGSIRKGQRGGS